MLNLLHDQLIDPFRIVMLIALVMVWDRNRGPDGTFLPLLAGYAFVAVLLPSTMGPPGQVVPGILVGLASNFIILGVVVGLWGIWQRMRKG